MLPVGTGCRSPGVEVAVGLLRWFEYAGRCSVHGIPAQDGTNVLAGGTTKEVGSLLTTPDDLGQRAADDLAVVEGRDIRVVGNQGVGTSGRIADVVTGHFAGMDNTRVSSTCAFAPCNGAPGWEEAAAGGVPIQWTVTLVPHPTPELYLPDVFQAHHTRLVWMLWHCVYGKVGVGQTAIIQQNQYTWSNHRTESSERTPHS